MPPNIHQLRPGSTWICLVQPSPRQTLGTAPRLFEIDRNLRGGWQGQQGSNLRPAVLETAALPTELYP
ncbi:MAG: hypothetical protein K0Q60_2056 [Microvirga sp.]|jgi:hypothetical protein|nr:hypothetical protein [Microvirga sp.]